MLFFQRHFSWFVRHKNSSSLSIRVMVLHSIPLYDRNLSYCPILKLTVSSAFLSSFSKSAPFVIFVVATEIASLASLKYGPVVVFSCNVSRNFCSKVYNLSRYSVSTKEIIRCCICIRISCWCPCRNCSTRENIII